MATPVVAPPLVRIREAAEQLGVSTAHGYRMARDGVLPVTRLTPGGLRVPRRAFESWLAQLNDDALEHLSR